MAIPSGSAPEMPSGKVYAVPTSDHVSLGGTIRSLLFWLPTVALLFLLGRGVTLDRVEERIPAWVAAAGVATLWHRVVSGVRVAAAWEQGVVLRLGNLHRIHPGGLFYVLPGIDYVRFIDTRTLVLNIPQQKSITRDNVPAVIDSALFFTVIDPALAMTTVQDFRFAVAQYTQAALRDVIGASTLDELLSEREAIQERIATLVRERVATWGLRVDSLQLQDFELPEELKQVMSRQAAAEREKRATITKSEGDRLAAVNLAEAANLLAPNPMAMELRTLQSLDALGSGPNNTVVLFPMALSQALQALGGLPTPSSQGLAPPPTPGDS